jgi:hypothetical protein
VFKPKEKKKKRWGTLLFIHTVPTRRKINENPARHLTGLLVMRGGGISKDEIKFMTGFLPIVRAPTSIT